MRRLNPNLRWEVGVKEFPHPLRDELDDPAARLMLAPHDDDDDYANPGQSYGRAPDTDDFIPIFLLAISMFGFVAQMTSLVLEKELKLRQAMTIMGLYETAYWLSWIIWEALVTSLSSLLIVLFGMMFQFNIFLHNNFMLWFLLVFLYLMSMTAFACAISAFVNKSSSTTSAGMYVFLIGIITMSVAAASSPYENVKFKSIHRVIWSLCPPNLLDGALTKLKSAIDASPDHGITWNGSARCAPGDSKCLVTIVYLYGMLIFNYLTWLLLAIYFDNILPNPYGVRKSIFYFLNPRYYVGKSGNKVEGGLCSCCTSSIPQQQHMIPDDEDVLEEKTKVKEMAREGRTNPNVAVQIQGLVKIYPGKCQIRKCKRVSSYQALKGL